MYFVLLVLHSIFSPSNNIVIPPGTSGLICEREKAGRSEDRADVPISLRLAHISHYAQTSDRDTLAYFHETLSQVYNLKK